MFERFARHLAVVLVGTSLAGRLAAQNTERLSIGTGGSQGNIGSFAPSMTPNGRYVAFFSAASLTGDSNGTSDIFVRDRALGTTSLVSLGPTGMSNGASLYPSTSDDGRYVAFDSYATNLASGDVNGDWDTFLYDRATGTTLLLSRSLTGFTGNSDSVLAHVSGNGSRVAFVSWADDLVSADGNGCGDIFVWDLNTNQLALASTDSTGAQANQESYAPRVSGDGRYVAFDSYASNLVLGDANMKTDVFVKDLVTGHVDRVSVSTSGLEANGSSYVPSISSDGRYVAFESMASNLVTGDTNSKSDIFVHDRLVGWTKLVSASATGVIGNGHSYGAAVSADGGYIGFHSLASNLVNDDFNLRGDVFLKYVPTSATTLISRNDSGVPGNQESRWANVARYGAAVTFESDATNLVASDSNGVSDVFARVFGTVFFEDSDGDGFGNPAQWLMATSAPPGYVADDTDCDDTAVAVHPGATELCNGIDDDCDGGVDEGVSATYYPDTDGDGFGDPSASIVTCTPPQGYVLDSTDCNDSNPAVNPSATETCNSIDDDCDGLVDEGVIDVTTYCTAGTTVHACLPQISGEGMPSASLSTGFDVIVSQVEGGRFGTIFYGFYQHITPWAPGSASYKCIANPVQRTGVVPTGGTTGQCDGELVLPLNAWLQTHPSALGSPFVPGQVFQAQGWFRDPGAPKQTNLSNALRFTLCN